MVDLGGEQWAQWALVGVIVLMQHRLIIIVGTSKGNESMARSRQAGMCDRCQNKVNRLSLYMKLAKQTQRWETANRYKVCCTMYDNRHHSKSPLICWWLLFAPHWTTHPLDNVQVSTLRILFGIAFTWPAGSFRRLGWYEQFLYPQEYLRSNCVDSMINWTLNACCMFC